MLAPSEGWSKDNLTVSMEWLGVDDHRSKQYIVSFQDKRRSRREFEMTESGWNLERAWHWGALMLMRVTPRRNSWGMANLVWLLNNPSIFKCLMFRTSKLIYFKLTTRWLLKMAKAQKELCDDVSGNKMTIKGILDQYIWSSECESREGTTQPTEPTSLPRTGQAGFLAARGQPSCSALTKLAWDPARPVLLFILNQLVLDIFFLRNLEIITWTCW